MRDKALVNLVGSLLTLGVSFYAQGSSIIASADQRYENFISPTNSEIQDLRQKVRRNITTALKDYRTASEKQKYENFVNAWKKEDSNIAPFLGTWAGYKYTISIYPSVRKGRVCIVSSEGGDSFFQTGIIVKDKILSASRVLAKEGAYLSHAILYNGTLDALQEMPLVNPTISRVEEILKSSPNLSYEDAQQIDKQFHASGCSDSTPDTPSEQKLKISIWNDLFKSSYEGNQKESYFITEVDLNGDGSKEIIVSTNAGMYCGNRSCEAYIYRREGSGYRLVSPISRGVVFAQMKTKTNGWYDLATHVPSYDNKYYWGVYKFNGKEYQPANQTFNLNAKPGKIIVQQTPNTRTISVFPPFEEQQPEAAIQPFKELGDTYFDRQQWQEAIEVYSQGIKYAEVADLYYNRAIAHKSLGYKQAALDDLQVAAKLYRQQGEQSQYQETQTEIEEIAKTIPSKKQELCPQGMNPVTIESPDGESPAYAFAKTAGRYKNGARTENGTHGTSDRDKDGNPISIAAGTRCIKFEEIANPEKPKRTWIVIHGWNNDSKSGNIYNLAKQIKDKNQGDRVLILDWGEAAYNQGRFFIGNLSVRGNYYAATWIRPVAEVAVQLLKEKYGITDAEAKKSLHLVGHSLGSIVSAEIGSMYSQGVNSIVALDPASEVNIQFDAWSQLGGYDVDGRTPAYKTSELQKLLNLITLGDKPARTIAENNIDRPRCFSQASNLANRNANCDSSKRVSRFSRAFTGSQSVAGNIGLASTADEAFIMYFGNRFSLPGQEHGEVVNAYTEIIKKGGFGGLFGLEDNRSHGEIIPNSYLNDFVGITTTANPAVPKNCDRCFDGYIKFEGNLAEQILKLQLRGQGAVYLKLGEQYVIRDGKGEDKIGTVDRLFKLNR